VPRQTKQEDSAPEPAGAEGLGRAAQPLPYARLINTFLTQDFYLTAYKKQKEVTLSLTIAKFFVEVAVELRRFTSMHRADSYSKFRNTSEEGSGNRRDEVGE